MGLAAANGGCASPGNEVERHLLLEVLIASMSHHEKKKEKKKELIPAGKNLLLGCILTFVPQTLHVSCVHAAISEHGVGARHRGRRTQRLPRAAWPHLSHTGAKPGCHFTPIRLCTCRLCCSHTALPRQRCSVKNNMLPPAQPFGTLFYLTERDLLSGCSMDLHEGSAQ